MDGFVLGLALFVAVGQLDKLFAVPKPDGNTVETFVGILKELPQANWVTFAVGAFALALLTGRNHHTVGMGDDLLNLFEQMDDTHDVRETYKRGPLNYTGSNVIH